jgi:hypothetical protein
MNMDADWTRTAAGQVEPDGKGAHRGNGRHPSGPARTSAGNTGAKALLGRIAGARMPRHAADPALPSEVVQGAPPPSRPGTGRRRRDGQSSGGQIGGSVAGNHDWNSPDQF